MRPHVTFSGLLSASLQVLLGFLLSAALLEVVLRANPTLLLHGMALPRPADPAVEVREYPVYTSDADVFYWMRNRIRPIAPAGNQREATVRFQTDEYGFPNPAPLSDRVDAVVLGRSFSMGAQAASPWTGLLSERMEWEVLNLSQAGSGLVTKIDHLRRFGLPRSPRWVILEILPSMDVIGFSVPARMIVAGLPFMVVHELAQRLRPTEAGGSDALYPIDLQIPGGGRPMVFFDGYVSALTMSEAEIVGSQEWRSFEDHLLDMRDLVRGHEACLAVLYAPTNAEIYLPLATDPSQVTPILESVGSFRLNETSHLTLDGETHCSVDCLRLNASAARHAVRSLAIRYGLVFIDPSEAMAVAALAGEDPFMTYDTHWSAIGHRIVAEAVAATLGQEACP